jgi:hypothetical protein
MALVRLTPARFSLRAKDVERTARVAVLVEGSSNGLVTMPYTRPYRRFYLTPPAFPTFVISVLLATLAVMAVYGHFTILNGVSSFLILLIAYVILLLGNLLRGV